MDQYGSPNDASRAKQRQHGIVVFVFIMRLIIQSAKLSAEIPHFVLIWSSQICPWRRSGIHIQWIPVTVKRRIFAGEFQVFLDWRLKNSPRDKNSLSLTKRVLCERDIRCYRRALPNQLPHSWRRIPSAGKTRFFLSPSARRRLETNPSPLLFSYKLRRL